MSKQDKTTKFSSPPKAAELLVDKALSEIRLGHITKAEILRHTKFSPSQLDAYLSGDSIPGMNAAERLAAAMGRGLAELIVEHKQVLGLSNPGSPEGLRQAVREEMASVFEEREKEAAAARSFLDDALRGIIGKALQLHSDGNPEIYKIVVTALNEAITQAQRMQPQAGAQDRSTPLPDQNFAESGGEFQDILEKISKDPNEARRVRLLLGLSERPKEFSKVKKDPLKKGSNTEKP